MLRREGIDWLRPWLQPLFAVGAPIEAAVRAGASVATACQMAATAPTRFVAARALPDDQAYEAFIARSSSVPTRDNRHDFFNALMWLHRPTLKHRLNVLQAAEIERDGVGQRRGAARDALTLFDENGAVLRAPAPLIEALRQRDWRGLFLTHRALWADAQIELFGHALLEKLCQPRKGMTAHVLVVDSPAADPLALSADAWAAKPFLPLPVLGVPGWWPGNEVPGFYDDAAVFRPPRVASFDR